ncbi:hypothetical protein [Defluviimonas salinarum]|uniref:Uncharacterized protein n=1 Tax=Defluviimonas salinarum TaxID=2992147 RepID=A0ABT3J414_9RHOB|nr:hypothetical protein [Defluviimonas salinarum]MCW3782139.1 hypothetical protein [Defluviimonas salinarum]
MNVELHLDPRPPAAALEDLISRHGPARVAAALLRVLAARLRPSRRRSADDLSGWLRRDIGLDPLGKSPEYWKFLP